MLARALLVASLAVTVPNLSAQQQPQLQQQEAKPCRWWQFRRCDEPPQEQIDGLPDGAPRSGTVVTVDLSTNTAYLFRDGQLLDKSPAATGTGKILRNGRKVW